MRRSVALAFVVLLAACGGSKATVATHPAPAESSTTAARTSTSANTPNVPGSQLLPGDNGRLPVRVLWSVASPEPEGAASDGTLIYVSNDTDALLAIEPHSGRVVWRMHGDPSDLELDLSGPKIGSSSADSVDLWDGTDVQLRVNRQNGAYLGTSGAGAFHAFAKAQPATFHVAVDDDTDDCVARYPNGTVAWRLTGGGEWSAYDPFVVDGVIVCSLANGYVVGLG